MGLDNLLNPTTETVFTTGDVSRICKVAPRTVSKWCDSGVLEHYRIPGSTDRRIPYASLMEFMRRNRMVIPTNMLMNDRILVFGCDVPIVAGMEMIPKMELMCVEIGMNKNIGAIVVGSGFGYATAEMLLSMMERVNPVVVRCLYKSLEDVMIPEMDVVYRTIEYPFNIDNVKALVDQNSRPISRIQIYNPKSNKGVK